MTVKTFSWRSTFKCKILRVRYISLQDEDLFLEDQLKTKFNTYMAAGCILLLYVNYLGEFAIWSHANLGYRRTFYLRKAMGIFFCKLVTFKGLEHLIFSP